MKTFWTNLQVMGSPATVVVTDDDPNGTILAVGGEELLRERSGPGRVEDLAGGVVTPGLWDSHLHLLEVGRSLRRLQFLDSDAKRTILLRVRDAAQSLAKGEWIVGGGFNREKFEADPDVRDLDRVAPHHPTVLMSLDYHTVWMNSEARQRLRIGQGMTYDIHGRFTGIVRERGAFEIQEALGRIGDKRADEDIMAAMKAANQMGLVGVTTIEAEPGLKSLQHVGHPRTLRAQVFLRQEGWHAELQSLKESLLESGVARDYLRIMGVKLFMDGALGSGTAWMKEPYRDKSHHLGMPLMDLTELQRQIREIHDAGLLVAVHAIGDCAVHEVIRALSENMPPQSIRDRIEHGQLVDDEDLLHLAHLQVALSMQPTHLQVDREIADRQWGERARHAFRFRDVINLGVPLVFGSDGPIVTIDPRPGLWAAVYRARVGEGAWYGGQAISPEAALTAYTETPALIDGRKSGRVAPGFWGDMTVWTKHPVKALIHKEYSDLMVSATIVGGHLVYRKP